MSNPQNNNRKHESETLRNIGVTVIGELCRVVLQDVFQNQDSLGTGISPDQKHEETPNRHTTLPARPPAMNANPIKRNNRALHTALESPNPSSPLTLSLSMRLMIKYPSKEQMPGIQSTKVTWTGASESGGDPHGDLACADRIAASKNVQLARAN